MYRIWKGNSRGSCRSGQLFTQRSNRLFAFPELSFAAAVLGRLAAGRRYKGYGGRSQTELADYLENTITFQEHFFITVVNTPFSITKDVRAFGVTGQLFAELASFISSLSSTRDRKSVV